MCGIAGFACFGNHRPTREQLEILWETQEQRGRSAAGVGFVHPTEGLVHVKQKGTASELSGSFSDERWKLIRDSPSALFHARATTKGSENNNVNNHPVDAGGWLVVHNGQVRNDDMLVEHYGIERPAEVDTVAINLALAQGKTLEESLPHLSVLAGAVTFAAIHKDSPNRVLLGRLGGPPVHVAYDSDSESLFWSSVADALLVAEGFKVGGLELPTIATLRDRTLLVIEPPYVGRYVVPYNPFFRAKPVVSGPARLLGGHSPYGIEIDGQGYIHTNSGSGKNEHHDASAEGTGAGRGRDRSGRYNSRGYTAGTYLSLAGASYLPLADYGKKSVKPEFEGVDVRFWRTPPGAQESAGKRFQQATPYGKWIFDDGKMMFKPHKRVRTYLARLFPESEGYGPILLPAGHQTKKIMDYRGLLEPVLMKTPGARLIGCICPWCGIITSTIIWKEWSFRCQWCGVMSTYIEPTPREGGDAA